MLLRLSRGSQAIQFCKSIICIVGRRARLVVVGWPSRTRLGLQQAAGERATAEQVSGQGASKRRRKNGYQSALDTQAAAKSGRFCEQRSGEPRQPVGRRAAASSGGHKVRLARLIAGALAPRWLALKSAHCARLGSCLIDG